MADWKDELPALAALSDADAAAAIRTMTVTETVATVTGQEIFEATTQADYTALTSAQKSLFHAIIAMASIQVAGANTRAALLAMFAAGTDTRANLVALQTRTVFKYPNPPHAGDVAAARSAIQ